MSRFASLRPVLPILLGASVLLSVSMGLRQSFGIFMPPITQDLHVTVAQFTLAIAVQNLMWGILQPLAGALVVKVGYRSLMLTGAILYMVGLVLMATAQGMLPIVLGAGVLIGAAMACTGTAITLSVSTRVVSPQARSMALGVVSAAGSLGSLVAAPLGQWLLQGHGWRMGMLGFIVLGLLMLPAAWKAGGVDRYAADNPRPAALGDDSTARQALAQAFRNVPFLITACAFFVCGMQLLFLSTHLPAYLELCGMDPMLSAQALGVIGGFNVLGSLFFGWAGGRWNKLALLGLIYVLRSIVVAWYFMHDPTASSTLVFAALMGFLWLGVSPLIAGAVAEMFGLRWQPMIQGVAFFCHQIGSFAGAFGGGLIYDALGNYNLAWQLAVLVGAIAGVVQILTGLLRPSSGASGPLLKPA
ncbi:MFS transporter [Comamonas serinivorans]|uniref:MFS transporter n=1 Tax=Comamonas serinivorans TaxID=1082851 RepID=A0A1Y0EK11_9BURK|nr:MFS transporter [Comamonas serinivorans]ARU03768.1 MFS transporter [Comamonas serinivorans]